MDTTKELPTVIAFCAGYGGIERGLDLAGFEHRVIAYVEIEAFAIANLPHLFTRILKPSQRTSFETALTSSLEVIPASRFQQQDSEREQMTQDTCGHLLGDTSNQLDLLDASLKTSRDTFRLDSPQSSAIWKKIVIEQRGEYLVRVKLAHHTKESESTSWATPRACSAMAAQITEKTSTAKYPNLETQIAQRFTWQTPTASDWRNMDTANQLMLSKQVKMWPTPQAMMPEQTYETWKARMERKTDPKSKNKKVPDNLAIAVKMWPTPTAHMGQEGGYPAEYTRKTPSLTAAATESEQKPHSSGYLNPDWVEWLMGVPTGWTDLDSWGTE